MAAVYESRREYDGRVVDTIPDTADYLFVTEWIVFGGGGGGGDDQYFAVGEELTTRRLAKFRAPFGSSLYVWAQSFDDVVCLLCNVKYVDYSRDIVELAGDFQTNGVSALDHVLGTKKVTATWKMFQIPTRTFADARNLYFMLNDTDHAGVSSYVKTTGTWTLETLVMLEMYKVHGTWHACYVYGVYMNGRLQQIDPPTPPLPTFDIVCFDIETVSHEPNRIPMGENRTDIIFSASVTKILHRTGERVHETVFNLPIDPASNARAEELMSATSAATTYSQFGLERRVTVVNSEVDLLRRVCDAFDSMPAQYVLLGYNSKNYDMLYIAKRLALLNMPEMNNVHCQQGILTYGTSMIHVDMFLVISKYFMNELPSFSLKTVVKEVLKGGGAAKVELDARLLRFVYRHIREFGLGDGHYTGPEWGHVTLAKMALYNDTDSLLVYRLWHDLQYNEFLLNVSKIYRLSLSRVSQSTISEYLANKILCDSFRRNVLFTQHHTTNVVVGGGSTPLLLTRFDNETLASSDGTDSYGGGFNYRDSKNVYRNVEMMDMVAYYPEMMDGFNLSHETVAIYTVGAMKTVLAATAGHDTAAAVVMNRFCTHKTAATAAVVDDDLVNNIDSKKYVSGSLDNASKITSLDLDRLDDGDRITVSLRDRRGLLSAIMKSRNEIRNTAKETKRLLQQAIDGVSELVLKKELGELDDCFDPDDDDDDDDDDAEAVKFSPDEYTIKFDPVGDGDEELVLVKSSVRLLSAQELYKFSLDDLLAYREMLKNEFSRINSQYRNLKIVNSSIYGLLGSKYGVLRGKHVAAVATMLGRKYIIETAKSGMQHGYRLVLSDTDSVFLAPEKVDHHTGVKPVVDKLNAINPCLKLNNKTYPHVFVIAKKTYFATYDGESFSRGINKNGPLLWADVMYGLYDEYIIRKCDVTLSCVLPILKRVYTTTYEKLRNDKTLVLCTMNVKEAAEYKTQTPAKKLMERIFATTPNYVFGKSITYFHLLQNNPRTVCFALDHELDGTPLSMLNVYKFYCKINMAVYHIISMAMTETNKRRGIYYTLNLADFNRYNLAAFLQARSEVAWV